MGDETNGTKALIDEYFRQSFFDGMECAARHLEFMGDHADETLVDWRVAAREIRSLMCQLRLKNETPPKVRGLPKRDSAIRKNR